MESVWVCPFCHRSLTASPGELHCTSCGRSFPVEDEIADFAEGRYYDQFDEHSAIDPQHEIGLRNEEEGTVRRIRDYYLPRLLGLPRPARAFRVLDCGCGNGISVDLLNDEGIAAWGNDLSQLRRWQWKRRRLRRRLVVAGGERLPFPDRFFGAIICSGVMEHLGVNETAVGGYRVEARPDRDELRKGFLRELLRVTGPGGVIWLDFPNGRFPIDFWHGTTTGGARRHARNEGFLPSFQEIEAYLRELDPEAQITALSPYRRLGFWQVGRHWYGRLLRIPALIFLWLMTLPGGRWVAASGINPFLVIEIRKP